MWAALHQSLDMVQLVIRHGANPHLMDERGEAVDECTLSAFIEFLPFLHVLPFELRFPFDEVLQMLSTDHLAVGESVVEIVNCNERLLEHAKVWVWHLSRAVIFLRHVSPSWCFQPWQIISKNVSKTNKPMWKPQQPVDRNCFSSEPLCGTFWYL